MSKSGTSSGVGFFSLLTLLFIGLKLGGVINWSWWLVLSPILFGGIVTIVFLIGVLVIIAKNK